MKEPAVLDYYRVLGITRFATPSQVKKAYHVSAKKHHPDKATPSKIQTCTKAFQELQLAYETLADSVLREAYDARYPTIKAQWDEYERHEKVRQAKRQKRTRFTQEIVIIRSTNDEFKVHGHMLKERSSYFRTQLESRGSTTFSFAVEDDVVAAYVHCLYHDEVQTELSEAVLEAAEEAGGSALVKLEHEFLAKLYIFGEKVQDDAFCDRVITALAATIDKRDAAGGRTFPNCKTVTAIYNGTTSGSLARQMMVDLYAENAGKHWFPERQYSHFHPEFAYDLVREVLVHKTQATPKGQISDRCQQWHKLR